MTKKKRARTVECPAWIVIEHNGNHTWTPMGFVYPHGSVTGFVYLYVTRSSALRAVEALVTNGGWEYDDLKIVRAKLSYDK